MKEKTKEERKSQAPEPPTRVGSCSSPRKALSALLLGKQLFLRHRLAHGPECLYNTAVEMVNRDRESGRVILQIESPLKISLKAEEASHCSCSFATLNHNLSDHLGWKAPFSPISYTAPYLPCENSSPSRR